MFQEMVNSIDSAAIQLDTMVERHFAESANDAPIDGTAPATVEQFCKVYAVARPVLVFLKGFLFLKPKWAHFVSALILVLDAECRVKLASLDTSVVDDGGGVVAKVGNSLYVAPPIDNGNQRYDGGIPERFGEPALPSAFAPDESPRE